MEEFLQSTGTRGDDDVNILSLPSPRKQLRRAFRVLDRCYDNSSSTCTFKPCAPRTALNFAPLFACRKAHAFDLPDGVFQPKRKSDGFIVSYKAGQAVKLLIDRHSNQLSVAIHPSYKLFAEKGNRDGWIFDGHLSDIKDLMECLQVVAWMVLLLGIPKVAFAHGMTDYHAARAKVKQCRRRAQHRKRQKVMSDSL